MLSSLHTLSPSRGARVRRSVLALGVIAALGLSACSSSESSSTHEQASPDGDGFTITDVLGREVSFDHQPERIILGEGRGVFATSALDKSNPLDKVIAMGTDLKDNVPDYYSKLVEAVPSVKDLPEIGSFQKGDVGLENLVNLDPDVLVLSQDQYDAAKTTGTTDKLDSLGLKYVVTDFRAHPLTNTTTSIDIYGKLLGKEDAAQAFSKDWSRVVDMVRDRGSKVQDKPRTFVWRAAGLSDCCGTWNNSNISELVNVAGGENVGDKVLDGESGNLTPEKVIDLDPEVIIATGGDWSAKKGKDGKPATFASAGYAIPQEDAEKSLQHLPSVQPAFDLLRAPKEGNLHAIWHQFYNSPLNYLALLQIAQWLHPEDYHDVDIAKEWSEAHDKYVPFSGEGSFFVSTPGAAEK